MHKCKKSCFKYCKSNGPFLCRHHFPYCQSSENSECVISQYHDSRQRRNIRAIPPRNNGNLNSTFFDPLLAIAHGGNHDCQYISNSMGAAEYAASYTL